jgi:Protein of unknown function (DUF3761)
MRKMIFGSIAVGAIFAFALPDEIKNNGFGATPSIEARAAGPKAATAEKPPACHDVPGYYINSDRRWVHRPECFVDQPGETAICRDGSHSFSLHHNGTCSHHGGVARWERY